MQANQNKKKKAKFTGWKILIGALSVTGTFGIWGLIADKPANPVLPLQGTGSNDQQSGNTLVLNTQPLPTLVPVRGINSLQNSIDTTANQQTPSLRQVTQPTLAPIPVNNAPVFERLTITRPGGGSGGSSGAASSGSSR